MQPNEEQINNLLETVGKNRDDIGQLKNDYNKMKESIDHIEKIVIKNDRANLCVLHDEKLKTIEKSLENLQKGAMVRARNGSTEKKDRPIREVVAETHEAIYWMKPFGLFMLYIYDFIRKHKIWSMVIGLCMIVFHDPFFKFLGKLLKVPYEIIKPYLDKLL